MTARLHNTQDRPSVMTLKTLEGRLLYESIDPKGNEIEINQLIDRLDISTILYERGMYFPSFLKKLNCLTVREK